LICIEIGALISISLASTFDVTLVITGKASVGRQAGAETPRLGSFSNLDLNNEAEENFQRLLSDKRSQNRSWSRFEQSLPAMLALQNVSDS
jgi:hypothetical protein